jgi:hypothetical protein
LAFASAADFALPSDDLGDFLRNFLDIRLPFVAFRGSIITALWPPFGKRIRSVGWARLMGPEYWYKIFDARLSTR